MPFSLIEQVNARLQTGDLDGALALLDSHLEANPRDDEARRLRAGVHARLPGDEHQQAALADLDAITAPTAHDWVQRCNAYWRLNQFDAAQAAIEQARALNPSDESLIQHHVYLLMGFHRYAEARALLDTMPETWVWLQLAGDLASEQEGPEAAIDAYTRALDDLGRALAGASSDAERRFLASFKGQMLASRAQMHATMEAWDQADADYAAAQAIIPDDPMHGFMRGLIAAERGDLDTALALCGESLAVAPAALQRSMEGMLRANPRYLPLAALLLQGDADI